jgi:hypothetical protein
MDFSPASDRRQISLLLSTKPALGLATIRRAEGAEGATSLTMANDLAVRRAFESPGVEFIDENGGGPGVRLRKRQPRKG